MQKKSYQFSSKEVAYYFDADFSFLEKLTDKNNTIIITDENVFNSQKKKFAGWKTIVIKAGEEFKKQSTVDLIIQQLISHGADRKTFVIGVGGGVVTDITGYAASVYMRGVKFGFAPTSVLAMVDASIGGKNGVDVGVYKNLVGLIKQPEFLLYDFSLLRSLPKEEWVNGFAEIIKHAAIKDARLFNELEKNKLSFYQKDKTALAKLIRKNVMIKSGVVQKDEFEKGDRKLLNFGHTLGHAIENLYQLPHGHAISIGMVAACLLSEQFANFKETGRIVDVLKKYGLPTFAEIDSKKVFQVLKMDKKKELSSMNYILLKKIGTAFIKPIPIDELEELVKSITMSR
ncbi:MAG: 3-dehydroquinate synthase [Bacteroidetes bacterium]|nr:3-dehydroquinate synthase [Bacteroidota bacterium]